MAGHTYTHRAQLPRGLLLVPSAGYDGQFYYRLALDPVNWDKTAFGITMDQSYRYTRIGYPILAWLVSLGQHQLVPVALVAINLVAVAAMAYLGAMFARDAGRHALWGLAFAAYFGLVISVGRDTAEPLAEACMLGGLLAYRRNRPLLATAAFAVGAITRETILLAPAAIAVTRLVAMARRRARPGLADLTWVGARVRLRLGRARGSFRGQGRVPAAGEQRPQPRRAVHGDDRRAEVRHQAHQHRSPEPDRHLPARVRHAGHLRPGRAGGPAGHHRAGARAPGLRVLRAPARPALQPDLDQHLRGRAVAHRALPDGADPAARHAPAVPVVALPGPDHRLRGPGAAGGGQAPHPVHVSTQVIPGWPRRLSRLAFQTMMM